jgi:hypothetical protein
MKLLITLEFDTKMAQEENIKEDIKQILLYGGLHDVNSLKKINIKEIK